MTEKNKDLFKHFKNVLRHKRFVFSCGLKVGGIPLWRLIIHDWSKFFPTESDAYIKRYIHNDYSEAEWKSAWLHHVLYNPHHFEHWMINGEALPMPETYIREMVADWMAAGISYDGTEDIQDWLNKDAPKMNLHPETHTTLCRILKQHGITWPPSAP